MAAAEAERGWQTQSFAECIVDLTAGVSGWNWKPPSRQSVLWLVREIKCPLNFPGTEGEALNVKTVLYK